MGRNGNSHEKKVEDLIKQIEKMLNKEMSGRDRKYLEQELDELRRVMGEK